MMAFWFIACNGVMVFLLLRYRRTKSHDMSVSLKGNHMLEVVWTVVPTILCGIIFFYGIQAWEDMRTMPTDQDHLPISVRGQKWSWAYTYPDGRVEAGDLYVPQGRPVVLTMKSYDVLHSFFIPAFRVKEDVVPSFYTKLWFKADKVGDYNIFCTEYCGDNHSAMMGKVHVLSPDDWQKYERNELFPVLSPLEQGGKLYVDRGCKGCHSTDGAAGTGPTFKNLMGREEVLQDGSKVIVDENYISESIKYPNRKLVAGFPAGQMPSFDGQLSDEQIDHLITFIKTLQ
jgi:cytochrome c oxidase subunit 2